MLRKIVCASVVFALIVVVAKAEELRVMITKVDPEKGTISYKVSGKKGDAPSDEVTAKVDPKATFAKGKFDADTKKLVAGDPISEGIKADVFSKISEKGVRATITTNDDKAITSVIIAGGKKKE